MTLAGKWSRSQCPHTPICSQHWVWPPLHSCLRTSSPTPSATPRPHPQHCCRPHEHRQGIPSHTQSYLLNIDYHRAGACCGLLSAFCSCLFSMHAFEPVNSCNAIVVDLRQAPAAVCRNFWWHQINLASTVCRSLKMLLCTINTVES